MQIQTMLLKFRSSYENPPINILILLQVQTQEVEDGFATDERDNNIPQRGTFHPSEDSCKVRHGAV